MLQRKLIFSPDGNVYVFVGSRNVVGEEIDRPSSANAPRAGEATHHLRHVQAVSKGFYHDRLLAGQAGDRSEIAALDPCTIQKMFNPGAIQKFFNYLILNAAGR